MNVLQHNGKKGGPPPPSFFIPLFRPLIQSHSTHRLEEEEEEAERGGGGNRSHKSPLWKKEGKEEKRQHMWNEYMGVYTVSSVASAYSAAENLHFAYLFSSTSLNWPSDCFS